MESTIGLVKTEVIDHEQPIWHHWREVENATAVPPRLWRVRYADSRVRAVFS